MWATLIPRLNEARRRTQAAERTRTKTRKGARGFTLLEVLTVLFIVGLGTALVAPNFPALLDRVVNANQRDSLLREINSLPFRALDTAQDYVLRGEVFTAEDGTLETQPVPGAELVTLRAFNIRDAELQLPQGWTLVFPEPIFYRTSGFCSGGTMELDTGAAITTYVLTPPLCQIKD